MKIRIFNLAVLAFTVLTILTSCNKTPDVTPQFQRGGNSLVLAANGNIVIAGFNTSVKGYEATLVMTTNTNSDSIVWAATYGGSSASTFYSVKKSNQGGFIATGFSNRSSANSPAMLVVITDAAGKMVKSKTYGGSALTQGFNVIPNADSGYLVAGVIQKTSNSDHDIYLVRINDSGDTLWTKSLGANRIDQYDTVNDAAYGVIAAPGGGYFLTGSLNGYSQYGGKVFLMKVSAKGDSLWTKTYTTGIGYSLTLTHQNGVIDGIAISGSLQEGSSQDIFLIKTDLDGKRLWSKTFGGSGMENGASMVETSDGGFAIAGTTNSKGFGNQDVYLIHTNSLGESPWEKTYGAAGDDQGFGLVEMPNNGGYCITGLSNSGGSFIYLSRTSSDGTKIWEKYIK